MATDLFLVNHTPSNPPGGLPTPPNYLLSKHQSMFRLFLSRASRVAPLQFASPSWKRAFHATASAQAKLNVEGLADKVNLQGQNVLVRVDLNVPLAKVSDENWVILIDTPAVFRLFLTKHLHTICFDAYFQ